MQFKNCSLPTFSNTKLICDDCDKGILNLQGKVNGNIKDGAIFNLEILPESYGDCTINTTKNNIECFNKEDIEDNKIIIPETTVRDKNNTELFRLKRVISGINDISSPINLNLHSNIPVETPSTSDIPSDINISTDDAKSTDIESTIIPDTSESSDIESTIIPDTSKSSDIESTIIPDTSGTEKNNSIAEYHLTRKGSKNGLSAGAIAAIIISCTFVLLLITVIAYFTKSGKFGNKKVNNTLENSTNFNNNVGKIESTSLKLFYLLNYFLNYLILKSD